MALGYENILGSFTFIDLICFLVSMTYRWYLENYVFYQGKRGLYVEKRFEEKVRRVFPGYGETEAGFDV